MSTEIFPLGNALSWSTPIPIAPVFDTKIAQSISGREKRAAMRLWPIWEITLNWDVLRAGLDGVDDLQAIEAFYVARKGAWDDFLIDLQAVTGRHTDGYADDLSIATGDGRTTVFPLIRPVTRDPSVWVFGSDLSSVRVNGSATVYSHTAPNIVTFAVAPAAGAPITASYRYYLPCRFSDDTVTFEQFSATMWQLHEVKLQTVIL